MHENETQVLHCVQNDRFVQEEHGYSVNFRRRKRVTCNFSEPALLFTAHCLLRAQKRPFSAKAKNGLFKSSFFYSYAAIQRPETLLLPG